MRGTWTIGLAIVWFAGLFAACGSQTEETAGSPEFFDEVDCSEASAAAEVQVGRGFVFEPSDVTIGAGEVVQWTWASSATREHDVVADADADCANAKPSWFQSETTSTSGHTYCVRFKEPGDWNYQCTVTGHCPNGMKGTVTVESQ